jgi:hypothetical protein
MSFWGIEEDYEAQAENAAAAMDQAASNDANEAEYESDAGLDYMLAQQQQQQQQQQTSGETAAEKAYEAEAAKQKGSSTVMFVVLGAAALGLYLLLKKK